jgi:hypothetical protein
MEGVARLTAPRLSSHAADTLCIDPAHPIQTADGDNNFHGVLSHTPKPARPSNPSAMSKTAALRESSCANKSANPESAGDANREALGWCSRRGERPSPAGQSTEI